SEDDDLQIHPDLWRGQAGTADRDHGLVHVGNKAVQLGRIEGRHGLGDPEQAGIAHLEDGVNCHACGNGYWLVGTGIPPMALSGATCRVDSCRETHDPKEPTMKPSPQAISRDHQAITRRLRRLALLLVAGGALWT